VTIAERYAEFLSRACLIAKELRIEIEFTTHVSGHGYMTSNAPCVEIVTTDTHEYLEVEGRVCIEAPPEGPAQPPAGGCASNALDLGSQEGRE
jgi:hypothetical protein